MRYVRGTLKLSRRRRDRRLERLVGRHTAAIPEPLLRLHNQCNQSSQKALREPRIPLPLAHFELERSPAHDGASSPRPAICSQTTQSSSHHRPLLLEADEVAAFLLVGIAPFVRPDRHTQSWPEVGQVLSLQPLIRIGFPLPRDRARTRLRLYRNGVFLAPLC